MIIITDLKFPAVVFFNAMAIYPQSGQVIDKYYRRIFLLTVVINQNSLFVGNVSVVALPEGKNFLR